MPARGFSGPGEQFQAQRICHWLGCLHAKTLACQVVLGEHPHPYPSKARNGYLMSHP